MSLRSKTLLSALGGLTLAAGVLVPPVSATTSDPLRPQQWGLDQVKAEQAWATSTGDGVVVAVVDSGVDLTHPDLAANLVGGATFVDCGPGGGPCGNGDWRGPDGVGQDLDTHGTHVSGIVAAVTDNGLGVAGTAPEAQVMPIKALEDGSGSFEDIAAGITYAVDRGADVVNLSLGALPGVQALELTGVDSTVTEAIAYAAANGVLVVAAAGNESVPLCASPSFNPGAICVTATDRNEMPAWYSNDGVKPDLEAVAAPGGQGLVLCEEDVVSTVPVGTGSEACGQSDYDYFAGTSMAAPHVAGVAALLYAQGRSYENVKEALLSTARQPFVDATGLYSPDYGHGIVDAEAAVAWPVVLDTTTGGGTGGSGTKGGNGGEKGNKGGKSDERGGKKDR